MSPAWKEWGLPALGVIIALTLYTTLTFAFVLDGEQYGTVGEWVGAIGAIFVGLFAVAFAGLAFVEAKSANLWAERAARAEEKAADLAERSLAARVRFAATVEQMLDGMTILRLTLDEESPMLWLQEVDVSMFSAGGHEDTESWLHNLTDACGVLTGQLPPGGHVDAPWLHIGNPMAPDIRDRVLVEFDVTYAVTDNPDGKTFTFPSLRLDIPPVPRVRAT